MSQTCRNLEIIVMDDGSTDSTPQIVQQIAETDSRIRLIQQPNQGTQYARLNAFNAATGEYIKSMDSDDVLIEDAVERLIAKALETDADMVIAPFVIRDESNGKVHQYDSIMPDFDEVSGAEYFCKICLRKAYWATWTALCKRTLFTSHKLELLPNTNPFEDVIFTTQLVLYSTKIAAINQPTVMYYIRDNSAWNSTQMKPAHMAAYRIYPDWTREFLDRIGMRGQFDKEVAFLKIRILFDCIHKRQLTAVVSEAKKALKSLHEFPELKNELGSMEKKIIRAFRRSHLWGYLKVHRYIRQGRL